MILLVVMGYLEDSPNSWNLCAFGKRVFDTAEIKAEELSELAFRAMLENNYVHVRLLREGRIDEAERLYLNITKVIPTQVFGFDVFSLRYRRPDLLPADHHRVHDRGERVDFRVFHHASGANRAVDAGIRERASSTPMAEHQLPPCGPHTPPREHDFALGLQQVDGGLQCLRIGIRNQNGNLQIAHA